MHTNLLLYELMCPYNQISDDANIWSADMAIRDPKEDRLGYSHFAEIMAKSICKLAPLEGFVIAIYGSWGSGKSTMLNFIIYYLNELPKDDQPVIIKFNPWWFSNREALIRNFFSQLQLVLTKAGISNEEIANKIADLSDLASEVPLPYFSNAKFIAKLVRPKQKDIDELKEAISKSLREQNKKILVIIDDIDRLTADEIREIFRLVKAVANFPSIIYLLSFDKEVAVKALSQLQHTSGEAYLNKIVQAPFQLPIPEEGSLSNMLRDKLNAILDGTPRDLIDETHTYNVYQNGLIRIISTPRDVVRFTNSLNLTYPSLKGEVNPMDFIAIEALRIFYPEIYEIIRENKDRYAGHASDTLAHDRDKLKSFHDEKINKLSENDKHYVKLLLTELFPKLKYIWDNTIIGAEWESEWRRKYRVCSPIFFARYFRFSIPSGELSNAEINSILALGNDSSEFGSKLLELASQKCPDGTTRVRAFLERIKDYIDERIPREYIPTIINAFFNIGDKILRPEDEGYGIFRLGSDVLIRFRINEIMSLLEKDQRFDVLNNAIFSSSSLVVIVEYIRMLDREHGRYGSQDKIPEKDQLLSGEQLTQLEQLALEKIRTAAQEGRLLNVQFLPSLLYGWMDWSNETEVKNWVKDITRDEKGLALFMEKFLSKHFTNSGIRYEMHLEDIEPFIDPAQIIEQCRILASKELPDIQRTAITELIDKYDKQQR